MRAKSASFAEHQQGMWGLMCGLTPAFGLGGAYHVGWAVVLATAIGTRSWPNTVAVIALSLAVVFAVWMRFSDSRRKKRAPANGAAEASPAASRSFSSRSGPPARRHSHHSRMAWERQNYQHPAGGQAK